jgi:ABC-2 type transport system permease protein
VIAQIRAELLKIRSTRTTLGLMLGTIALVVALTLLTGLLEGAPRLAETENQRQLLGLGNIAGLFAAIAGILVVTSEYRFGTIRPTFLVTPSWPRILGAKLVASIVSGIVFGVVGMAFSYAIGYLCLAQRGVPHTLSGGDIALLLAGSVISTGLFAGIGVGLGTLVRNQIWSVIALLAWSFVLETLVFALVPSVGRFGPGEGQSALIGSSADHLLSPLLGGFVLLAWMLGLTAAGLAWTSRRDVA